MCDVKIINEYIIGISVNVTATKMGNSWDVLSKLTVLN